MTRIRYNKFMIENKHKINSLIGELLGRGYSHLEICESLVQNGVDKKVAASAIAGFYDSIQETNRSADLENPERVRNWHVFMRQKLLRRSLEDSSPTGLKTSLAVLDSLSVVQKVNVGTLDDQSPITINFLPATVEQAEV